jgi:hypothetical protein
VRAALLIVGAVFEFFGIVAVAAPDLVPWLTRFSGWVLTRWRRGTNRVRRWLRLPPRTVTGEVHLTGSAHAHASVSAVVSVDPGGTLERKVEFLLQRNQEAQVRATELDERLSAIEEKTPRQLEALAGEMREHVSGELGRAFAANRLARIFGAAALVVGLGLTTAANFL